MPDIVCTIGPASETPELQCRLRCITPRFRLNTGHLAPNKLRERLAQLALLADEPPYRGRLAVTLDLQGAKIRIGRYPSGFLQTGPIELRLGDVSDDPRVIPVPCACVFEQAHPGEEILLLNDGKVRVQITEKPASDRLLGHCLQGGELGPAKGLNRPRQPYVLTAVPQHDIEAIRVGLEFSFADFALSFVASVADAASYRALIADRRLIGKIERVAAIDALHDLDRAFDELWFCRGDLGTEVEPYELGRVQMNFVKEIATLTKPVLLAGEVLGSMVSHPWPSRSEIVHLYDALHSGFSGFVLSDETAVGNQVERVADFLQVFFSAR